MTCIDTTSPVLSIGSNISLTVGDTWAGETAGAHYSAVDNLDGDLTSAIVVTGWNGDTTTAGTFSRTYTVQDANLNTATASKSAVIAEPNLFSDSTTYTVAGIHSLGTALTSVSDQMALGTGHGYEIQFSFMVGSDTEGPILAILDSTRPSNQGALTYWEAWETWAAIAFRRMGDDRVVRMPASHSSPGWNGNRYFDEPTRASGAWWLSQVYPSPMENTWHTVTFRCWHKDQNSFGMFFHVSSGSQAVADLPRTFPNTDYAPFVGRTSSWSGYSVFGIPAGNTAHGATAGQLIPEHLHSGQHVTTGGELKDLVIKALDPAADHTQPP